MDSFRYYLALLLVVLAPPALLFWVLVHPLVGFWRRLGVVWTYVGVGGVLAGSILALFCLRGRLLVVEFGTQPLLMAAGCVSVGAAVLMLTRLKKQLTLRIQMGIPELTPQSGRQVLLTEGIYGRIRHPRYVELGLGLLGYALISNYLAVYVLFLASLPILYLVAVLEERELHERFGQSYADYCRRVPRFLPDLRRRRQA
jgi:protein-S-isoprenylcysteine O-methyltransferase Ste14